VKTHRIGLLVLVIVLGLAVMPAFAQGPFPPPPMVPPPLEGMRTVYSNPNIPIGGQQYMRTFMQNWQQASDVTNYGWQILGHRTVPNGGLWITAARSATYTAPAMAVGFTPAFMYDYSNQMAWDRACAVSNCNEMH